MRKHLLFTVALVVCCWTGNGQDVVNLRMSREQLGLRGAVSSLDEDHLERKDYFRSDWPQRSWFRKDLRQFLQETDGRIITFRSNGLLNEVTYTRQGVKGRTTSCTYSRGGLLNHFTGDGYKMEAAYKGNQVDVNLFAETRSYDQKVDLARADLNTTAFKYTYPFDMKCRQQLSDENRVLRSTYYYIDSMPAREYNYVYDYRGLVTEERLRDYSRGGDGTEVVTSYRYDGNGFLISKSVKGIAADDLYTYRNNKWGDCVELKIDYAYGTTVYDFEYEYDSIGNWTMRLCFKDGEFLDATLRTLTYYKMSRKQRSASDGELVLAFDEPAYESDDVATHADGAPKKGKAQVKSKRAPEQTERQAPATVKRSKKGEASSAPEAPSKKSASKEAKASKKKDAKSAADKPKDQSQKQQTVKQNKSEKTAVKKTDKASKKKDQGANADKKSNKKEQKQTVATDKKQQSDKQAVKAEKAAKKAQAKADKERAKAEKAALKEQQKAEKAAKKAQAKAEKERIKAEKAAQKERAKAEKEAKKAQEKAAKSSKKAKNK